MPVQILFVHKLHMYVIAKETCSGLARTFRVNSYAFIHDHLNNRYTTNKGGLGLQSISRQNKLSGHNLSHW